MPRLYRVGRRIPLVIVLVLVWFLWGLNLPEHSNAPVLAKVVASIYHLSISGALPMSLLVSLGRIVMGFLGAFIIAAIVGVAMGYWRVVERSLDPLIQTVRHVAPIAVVPLAILWFGTGSPAAVFVIAYASFFPLILNVIHGVQDTDITLLRAASTMGLSRLKIIRHVIWPSALPAIVNGARIAMGVAWMAVIAAELAVSARSGSASSGGIGQLMFVYYEYSIRTNNLVACMVGVGVMAFVLDSVFRAIQRRWLAWSMRTESESK